MRRGWCLICGSKERQEFAATAVDRVVREPGGDRRAVVRFVICPDCGHVYQDPMPDEADLARPRDEGYRSYFAGEEAAERDGGRRLCEELAPLVEALTPGRRVLDLGCGSRGILPAFRRRGWEVFAINPDPTWTAHVRRLVGGTEQSVATGCYDAGAFPGQTFSLILCARTIERLSDPAPTLRAMRTHLTEDGVLFLATPNLVNPPVADKLFEDLLAGAHVRLYSPGALRSVLARSGLRTRTELHDHPAFGMGVLAQLPQGPTQAATEGPLDDAAAIKDLFLAVQRGDASGPFGRNLAGLLRSQPSVVSALCRKARVHDKLRLRYWGYSVVAIAGVTEQGGEVPLVSWEGPGEGDAVPVGRIPAGAENVVLLGLGSGVEARRLASRLSAAQRLFIWETDLTLAKAVLRVADLSDLWLSGRVTFLLGERPVRSTPEPPVALYQTDAARHWDHSIYERIAERLVNPACAPAAPGRTRVAAGGRELRTRGNGMRATRRIEGVKL